VHSEFAVVVEFERERGALRGREVSPLQCCEDDVLDLVRRIDDKDRDVLEPELCSGCESLASVK